LGVGRAHLLTPLAADHGRVWLDRGVAADESQKGRWLVFKVDEFKSIETSKDESYSVISGVTIAGRPFRFKAVWWTDDKKNRLVNCAPFVQRYVYKHTPKEGHSPYIISGQAVGEADNIETAVSIGA
jgi:hypothetical protein